MGQRANQLDGQITKVMINNHQKVEAGQPLIQLDDTSYKLTLKQDMSALSAAKSKIKIDQSNIDAAKIRHTQDQFQSTLNAKNLARDKKLEAKHLIAKKALDTEYTSATVSKLQLKADKVLLEKAKQQRTLDQKNIQKLSDMVSNDQWQLSNTTIKASTTGYISNMFLQPGDYVQKQITYLVLSETIGGLLQISKKAIS